LIVCKPDFLTEIPTEEKENNRNRRKHSVLAPVRLEIVVREMSVKDNRKGNPAPYLPTIHRV
jgi:hypothetical protein